MRIIDVRQKPLRACCVFKYKGLIVSASTILEPFDIKVFPKESSGGALYNAATIPIAVKWIDRHTKLDDDAHWTLKE